MEWLKLTTKELGLKMDLERLGETRFHRERLFPNANDDERRSLGVQKKGKKRGGGQ